MNHDGSEMNGGSEIAAATGFQSSRSLATVIEDSSNMNLESNVVLKDPRRPGRVLIALIDKCPADLVVKISPSSGVIKNNLKVVLVLMCALCGIINGCAVTFVKVGLEVIYSDEFSDNILFALFVPCCGVSCVAIQMLFLNLSMKYYNNLDVMPIY